MKSKFLEKLEQLRTKEKGSFLVTENIEIKKTKDDLTIELKDSTSLEFGEYTIYVSKLTNKQIEKKVKDLYEKEMTFGIDKTIFLYDDELAM